MSAFQKIFNFITQPKIQRLAQKKLGKQLHAAWAAGDLHLFKEWIEHNPGVVPEMTFYEEKKEPFGYSQLHKTDLFQHLICQSQNTSFNFQCLQLLAKTGINLNQSIHGEPYLGAAFLYQKHEVIKLLLDHGANPNCPYGKDNTPPLHLAMTAKYNAPFLVQTLLNAGANPNLKNKIGETPLHLVNSISQEGQILTLVELLLRHGANPNLQDSQGHTPLERVISERSLLSSKLIAARLGKMIQVASEAATLQESNSHSKGTAQRASI